MTTPRIVVTGADGFIGRNLMVRLAEAGHTGVTPVGRGLDAAGMETALAGADVVFHLAGANRPADVADFTEINVGFTERVAHILKAGGRKPLIVFASSSRADEDTDYGRSKKMAETVLLDLAARGAAVTVVQRLPNVFGKWARPDYNSAVATFCHNAARGLPIETPRPETGLTLLYIDDLIDQWLPLAAGRTLAPGVSSPTGAYETTVGEVARTIQGFADDRRHALIDSVGVGLTRALYATFVANLPTDAFAYPLTAHTDPRGSFSEMLRTRTSGQFSYFTAHPGVTRGGHYHHTKTEKFLVVHGRARFRFRHILSGETHALETSADTPVVVETIPGWAHDITNIGDGEMVSLLWANEIFEPARPDTVAAKVA